MTTLLDKMANRLRRFGIRGLMKYIVISMGAVFVMDLIFNNQLSAYISFDKAAILSGQVWRLISFIFVPISASPFFIIFVLYFYWMIGEALEQEWGVAKFNLFYLIGIVGTIAAGMITGYASNFYLNLSLFFAFAILFPNFELYIFFIVRVKVKWLAYLDAAFFAYSLVVSGWPERIALLVSLANIALFFWHDVYRRIINIRRARQWRSHFR
jgi:hypothetical protein